MYGMGEKVKYASPYPALTKKALEELVGQNLMASHICQKDYYNLKVQG